MNMDMIVGGAPLGFWLIFGSIIAAILVFDLGYLGRKIKIMSLQQSMLMTAGYASFAMAFGFGVWWYYGPEKGALYFTALVLEQSLSIDNVFVMSVIFSYFSVPREHQHRVLFWGIIVAMVLRGLFIGAGTYIVHQFEWVLFIFAAFLIYTGIKMFMDSDEEPDLSHNKGVQWLTQHLPVTTEIQGSRFFIKKADEKGVIKSYATPLFLAFMVINLADIIFAVDSVPAVLSMTQDPFIVYTSNIFAILGLRALYFVIAALVERFIYLKHAMSILLVLIGIKIFTDFLIAPLDPILTLIITCSIIGVAILASLIQSRNVSLEK